MRYIIFFILFPTVCLSQGKIIEDEFTGEVYAKSEMFRFSSEDNYTAAILTGTIRDTVFIAHLMILPAEFNNVERAYFLCDNKRIDFPADRSDSQNAYFAMHLPDAKEVFSAQETRLKIGHVIFTIPPDAKNNMVALVKLYEKKNH